MTPPENASEKEMDEVVKRRREGAPLKLLEKLGTGATRLPSPFTVHLSSFALTRLSQDHSFVYIGSSRKSIFVFNSCSLQKKSRISDNV